MVARAVMPGNAGRAEVAHVPGVERQVVAHDVAMMDRKRRPDVEHAGQDLVTHIAEFRRIGRLRVGEQQGVEALRLPLAPQRKSTVNGSGPVGATPA